MDHDVEVLLLCSLDALDPDEESEVRDHLGACGACRREFIQCLEVVGQLALVTGAILPPIALRRGLLSAIAQAPDAVPRPSSHPCHEDESWADPGTPEPSSR
jgi:anti-sigma factor RsiW